MTRRKRPVRSVRLWAALLSMMLTFVVALVIALLTFDDFQRWRHLNYMWSDDMAVRTEGWVYIARHADDDPAVREAAGELLLELPPARQDEVVEALQRAGVWGPDFGVSWINWLARLAGGDAVSRQAVATEVAGVGMHGHPVMKLPEAAELVEQLLNDEDPLPRFYAVRAASNLPAERREAMLRQAADDPEPAVRRQAQLIGSVIGLDGIEPPAPSLVGASVDELLEHLQPLPELDNDNSLLDAWRAIVLLPLNDRTRPVLEQAATAPADALPDEVRAAAIARVPEVLSYEQATELGPWSQLAWFENATAAQLADVPLDRRALTDMMTAAIAAQRGQTLTGEQWQTLFETDVASVRHLLALAAIDQLDDTQLDELIRKLSSSFYDERRIAGAILAALHPSPTARAVVEDRLELENVWLVTRHLVLAQLIFNGDLPAIESHVDGLLTRESFPDTTALFLLLHAGSLDAVDEVLNPLGVDGGSVTRVLAGLRFQPLLDRYLPTEAMPSFDLYADPALQKYQVDRLRAWYLLNRQRLRFDRQQQVYRLVD